MSEIYRPASPRALRDALLWRNSSNEAIRQNETLTTDYGVSFAAIWETASLFRDPDGARLGDLRWIILRYQAEPGATAEVQASPDGGETWHCAVDTGPTPPTTPEKGSDTLKFDFFNVVGHNIVGRIILPSDAIFMPLGMAYEVNVRSEWEYENLDTPA